MFSSDSRRDFLKKSMVMGSGIGILGGVPMQAIEEMTKPKNKLPAWKGFNLLDFFSDHPDRGRPTKPEYIQWIADWGFDFVRIPISYPSYLSIDRSRAIRPDEVLNFDEARLEKVDELVERCHNHGLHVSLNLHRAPGFCINAGFVEPFNLWKDQEALDAFCAHWEMWAKRYRGISKKKLSFDLVNEPFQREDPNDQHSPGGPVNVEDYHRVAEAALVTIKSVKESRLVIADGNGGGGIAVPELGDLDLAQSCRGYHPFPISHYKASWVYKDPENIPPVNWPLNQGDKVWAIDSIREYYAPWKALIEQGIGVHCGECGGYNKTPHDVFLSWFADVLTVLGENKIGFGIWEFSGAFGVLNSGREDVEYEDWYGEKLDRKFLELLRSQI
ncbi:glycoside hydrolase family 5 protein [Algoriphagus halophilus]|uniref:Aryl-phospho-beta-D-glucosidase BglC, GH1 family n=1 Tax=Algoriphagus halophilus TaxID=226505 RepID=A0A1N6I065_9BACT|nr:cellulase family glycosylhydrolase [Algoriphagus halophilus]SIO25406.1 Aryl-phospho-beta-D-glucosidase BglC, GH1 family [Algoriphagus halophilus]